MSLGGLSAANVNSNDTVAEYEIAYKNPILGISVAVMCVLSILGNGFILGVFALKGSWDNKTKFDVSMVCSSLVIAVFFLPVCSYKLLATPSPHTSHVVCVVVDAIQGYCVLNHLLTACMTSFWNFINVKFPLQAIAWFQPLRTNLLIASSWIFVLIYEILYICVIVTNFEMGFSCVKAFKQVPKWIHLMTVYGVIIPSVLIILTVNSGFLILACKHMRTLNTQERNSTYLHLVDINREVPRVKGNRVDRKSIHYLQSLHWRFRRGRRLSLFLFLCIIIWLPTIGTASVITICYKCIDPLTLVFASGLSHSLSSITPPIFFILNAENIKFLWKLYHKFKCQVHLC